MPKQKSQKQQLQLLCVLLVAFAVMLGYSFRGSLNLPTESTLKQLRSNLASRQAELQRVTEEAEKYKEALEAAGREFQLLKHNPNLEREAQNKFDRILDEANVTKTKSTVNSLQNRGKSSLQQVNINVDFDDFSMRKLADLFETFGLKSLNDTAPLYWTKITISTRSQGRRPTAAMNRRGPGAPPQSPNATDQNKRTLSVSATVTSYSLHANASDLVFSNAPQPMKTAEPTHKTATAPRTTLRSKAAAAGKGELK